ncbi:alpha-ketoglutarate-dependent dioxygenase AlkB family protein [Dokdonia sp. Hel_I_53]|uniref:alpha-ketoglutarate-dependent dioxygenase AlkB family protein n=1 Tax=Dokdonia sp. Hel_I_53 TaxID=1566287 RepID=UPI0028F44150|nr:alpha-ketoglutarate-dependent dioxygenase AlkB [Dokdonia sp. Hel_I_53]
MMELFDSFPQKLNLPEADVVYYPAIFNKKEAAHYFETLYKNTHWRQDQIKVYGKVYPQPRLTALYANNSKPYSYSNITMHPERFTFALSEIKKKVEAITNVCFTTCLLNLYRDGQDSNGWHADNEKELGTEPVIASVSLGAERTFKLRKISDHRIKTKLTLEAGSMLIMKGTTQHKWQHQIPKTSKNVAPRINLTFRIINN